MHDIEKDNHYEKELDKIEDAIKSTLVIENPESIEKFLRSKLEIILDIFFEETYEKAYAQGYDEGHTEAQETMYIDD